eukprot:3523927-Pyramimonas_sp.AAC.1
MVCHWLDHMADHWSSWVNHGQDHVITIIDSRRRRLTRPPDVKPCKKEDVSPSCQESNTVARVWADARMRLVSKHASADVANNRPYPLARSRAPQC